MKDGTETDIAAIEIEVPKDIIDNTMTFLKSGLAQANIPIIHIRKSSGKKNRKSNTNKITIDNIIGQSPSIIKVKQAINKFANSKVTILIDGETGTGKELVARAIHSCSERRNAPFVVVDCTTLPAKLMESELFGHVKGAFNGAIDRTGLFRAADSGTIFLDEVGELPLYLQPKILRVLQEKTIRPVGGDEEVPVDVRVILATNRDLDAEVKAGRFREDLYYRINVGHIKLPPLRERKGDVPILVEHFLKRYLEEESKGQLQIEKSALDLFNTNDFPGNVRELENHIHKGVVQADSNIITSDDLALNAKARQGYSQSSSWVLDIMNTPLFVNSFNDGLEWLEGHEKEKQAVRKYFALAWLKAKGSDEDATCTRFAITRKVLNSMMVIENDDKFLQEIQDLRQKYNNKENPPPSLLDNKGEATTRSRAGRPCGSVDALIWATLLVVNEVLSGRDNNTPVKSDVYSEIYKWIFQKNVIPECIEDDKEIGREIYRYFHYLYNHHPKALEILKTEIKKDNRPQEDSNV